MEETSFERSRWPSSLFWIWALKGLSKSVVLGFILGGIWSLLSWKSFSEGSFGAKYGLLVSFPMDSLFVFLITSVATIVGMSIHTWDIVAMVFRKGLQDLAVRFLVTVITCLGVAIMLKYVSLKYEMGFDSGSLMILVVGFTSTMAFSSAYHVYCLYAVLDREGRSEYNSRPLGKTRRVAGFFLPVWDRTRVMVPWLWAVPLSFGSLMVAQWMNSRVGWPATLCYAVISSILFATWCIVRRVLDIVKPWGENERLYPAFETYR